MKTTDEVRSEYTRNDLGKSVSGKYLEHYEESSNVVVLDEDVARAFPNSQAVNNALRSLLELAHRTNA